MSRKSLRQFIRENRQEITDSIARVYGVNSAPTNDAEREEWVINNAALRWGWPGVR